MEPDLPLVHIDYSQFDQVLSNLLENAARHSPEGGVVEVVGAGRSVRCTSRSSITAPGSPPTSRDRLFEPFATATGAGSSGVGLTICRSIVEAHHGTISVSDTPGGGATLIVEVPSCA